jgi:hypothetical protein
MTQSPAPDTPERRLQRAFLAFYARKGAVGPALVAAGEAEARREGKEWPRKQRCTWAGSR